MKKAKDWIVNIFNGFCMALADSVPGVSGGTVAFLLGFYDKFINSLDDLFRGNLKTKKESLRFLVKLGLGWVIGFGISATVLSTLFTTKIYSMSSLFIGFILAAIPLVIKEEKDTIKGHYSHLIFTLIGIALVVGVTLIASGNSVNVNVADPNLFTYLYVLIAASIAITAMVLPGISGSTLLLVFGLYIPIMGAVKSLLSFDLSVIPILLTFGVGVVFGVVFFVKLIRMGLKNCRSQIIYAIIGMMLGSLFSIVMGPTTLDEPLKMLTFKTFDIFFFIVGGLIIAGLEVARRKLEKKK